MNLDNIIMKETEKKKAILIIGATGGVGKLLCEKFKKNGYYVIGNGRKKEVLEEMKRKGLIDDYIVGDLTNENDRKNIIEKIKDLKEKYDLKLFYNLGILYEYPGSFEKYSKEQIIQSCMVNYMSIQYMDQELLRENIVLDTIYMVSISAFYRGEWDYQYQANKSALAAYVEIMIVDDIKNNRKRKIIALFPDTIKTGEEGMGAKLKEYKKIPGEIFAEEVINIVNGKYTYIGYIFSIEDKSNKKDKSDEKDKSSEEDESSEIILYGINPDKETRRFEYKQKEFIKKLGEAIY